ncbi:hypothetical protein [Paenibacillus sp. FSL M7-0420]|uniref:hypothetical protein n=1 Tax=Paenibacillus sp. FSL M7-0420 TaxID=2921609 RepID=UPI0030F8BD38
MYMKNSIYYAGVKEYGPNVCQKQHTLATMQAYGPNVCEKQHTLYWREGNPIHPSG